MTGTGPSAAGPSADGPAPAGPADAVPGGGRSVAGSGLVVIGTGHLAIGAVAHRHVLAGMLRDGWVGSADDRPRPATGTVERQRAFWFQVSGVALVLLGEAVAAQERAGAPPSRRVGWGLGALAVLGGVAVPVSGFWALLVPAAALLTRARRAGRRGGT